MKTLYLIRHAKSCWEDPSAGDKERPLNTRGHKDAPYMAKHMQIEEKAPDLLLSSSAKRAMSTAQYFAKEFNISEEAIRIDNDLYNAAPEDILNAIRSVEDSVEVLYVFGHNPSITWFSNLFGEKDIENIPTSGIVKIVCHAEIWAEFDRSNARRGKFIYPKLLKMMS